MKSDVDYPIKYQNSDRSENHVEANEQPKPLGGITDLAIVKNSFHAADRCEDDRNHQWEEHQRQQQLASARSQGDSGQERSQNAESYSTEKTDAEQRRDQMP